MDAFFDGLPDDYVGEFHCGAMVSGVVAQINWLFDLILHAEDIAHSVDVPWEIQERDMLLRILHFGGNEELSGNALVVESARAAGLEVRSPREEHRRGGTVTVHVADFPAVHRELTAREILCDFRPDAGIRLGPHYFTSDDELRHVIGQIVEIVETGAHLPHLGVVAHH